MRHLHLFEIEDQRWFPGALREPMTDFMSFAGELTRGGYADFAARLRRAMAACGERRLVDLCSGGGGPARAIARILREDHAYPVDLLLTDLYPNLARWRPMKDAGDVDFVLDPVDATRVPPDVAGFRLVCNGFHHFRPEDARAVLRDAVAQRQGIAIFEAFDPGPYGATQPFVLLAMMLGLTPFVRPLRWSRLFYTYVVPAVPVCFFWDAVVSWLRIYSPDDLRELTASVDPVSAYDWEIGRGRTPGGPILSIFLIGTPRQAQQK
jgi:hypothetical protein